MHLVRADNKRAGEWGARWLDSDLCACVNFDSRVRSARSASLVWHGTGDRRSLASAGVGEMLRQIKQSPNNELRIHSEEIESNYRTMIISNSMGLILLSGALRSFRARKPRISFVCRRARCSARSSATPDNLCGNLIPLLIQFISFSLRSANQRRRMSRRTKRKRFHEIGLLGNQSVDSGKRRLCASVLRNNSLCKSVQERTGFCRTLWLQRWLLSRGGDRSNIRSGEDGLRDLPSTFPSARAHIVCSAGMDHATKWNKCDLFSMASCPHFRPAAKNHARARQAHHANAAMQQKYSAMNSIVHSVDCRCPCK